jgi:hypothetical protein
MQRSAGLSVQTARRRISGALAAAPGEAEIVIGSEEQGDQIGRIFAFWGDLVFFGNFF